MTDPKEEQRQQQIRREEQARRDSERPENQRKSAERPTHEAPVQQPIQPGTPAQPLPPTNAADSSRAHPSAPATPRAPDRVDEGGRSHEELENERRAAAETPVAEQPGRARAAINTGQDAYARGFAEGQAQGRGARTTSTRKVLTPDQVESFREFRDWFLGMERTKSPRTTIDETVRYLGELCGDPRAGDEPRIVEEGADVRRGDDRPY